jgi:biotin carboxylase
MQGPAICFAKAQGFTTVVVDGDAQASCVNRADRFEHIDLKDKEAITELAQSLQLKGGLAGIMTAGTDFSTTVAWVAQKLGLPGIPYEVACNASDKERMRRVFAQAGLASPNFFTLTAVPDAHFSLPFAYPAVVKPVDNMGARGCRLINTDKELQEAVHKALPFSRSGRVIIEEYMDGPEFSVDAIVYHGEITICGLADRHIFFPPYFIEMGHTMPTSLDASQAEALLELFSSGVRALGITDGAAKGDLKMTADGPMIGEIAARLSGGFMSGWTYPYSSGVEPTSAAIRIATGSAPGKLSPQRAWTSAERALISIPGLIYTITDLKEAKNIEYVKDIFLRVSCGDRVQFPDNNVSKCGNVISAAPTRTAAVNAAEQAVRSILIRLIAPDPQTEAFLASFILYPDNSTATVYPPDAFLISDSIRSALQQLPDPQPGKNLSLIPFPALTESRCTDWAGRTVLESLEAVRSLTCNALPLRSSAAGALGRRFWAALIRGGYQGAAYLVDTVQTL